jgi:hypothetical protein
VRLRIGVALQDVGIDTLMTAEAVVKHKEVVVAVTPPLSGLGFLSTELAPRKIEPIHQLQIILELTLPGCSELGIAGNICLLQNFYHNFAARK